MVLADESPIGVRVVCRTGGPSMRVIGVDDERLVCMWWNDRGRVATAILPRATVVRVNPPQRRRP